MTIKLRVISLGAGVQSTTMALMAAHGEIGPMPDCAIFADTGWEPKAVYDHLAWLRSPNVLPFPVYVVSAGNLREDITEFVAGRRKRNVAPPWFVTNQEGGQGMLRRQCTRQYKIDPIERKVRELLGFKKRQRKPKEPVVEQWIGISLDEIFRVKPAHERWIANRWPLLERRSARSDCLLWLERNGYPRPPKSACIGCPYRDNASWRAMRDGSPEEFADAVAIDSMIRTMWPRTTGNCFVHRDMKPLDQVDLSTAEDRGQLNLFNNECEGMCGV
jgi:hypothetical protein